MPQTSETGLSEMPLPKFAILCACLILFSSTLQAQDTAKTGASGNRKFAVHYEFEIADLEPSVELKVWCPVPSPNAHQQVRLGKVNGWQIETEPRYGNKMAFATRTTSTVPEQFQLHYEVLRSEVITSKPSNELPVDDNVDKEKWLKANILVPLEGKHLRLLSSIKPTDDKFTESRQLYDLVLNHVDYQKDKPGWGRGDAVWVCDSRFGNCTDFHSLFIALSRVRQIPAKFEIGFSIPSGDGGELKGYHCWAWFYDTQRGWVPVDISEADKNPKQAEYFFGSLTADRVALSTGRDIVLQPPQSGAPLNFFIAPYAEANGKAVPPQKITLKHSWKKAD